jgi:hypothetical protein
MYPVGARLRHYSGSAWVVLVWDEASGDYTIRCVVGTERPGWRGGEKEGATRTVHAEYLENPSSWRRECACGCGTVIDHLRPNAIYANRACNTRAWRAREGIVGYRAVKRSQRPKKSGRQVSYKKAEKFVRISLSGASPELAAHVLRALAMALPDRQRALLATREQREETT